jgi:hypothetical protein
MKAANSDGRKRDTTVKYHLASMTDQEINQVIYEHIYGSSVAPCTGPITVNICVKTEMPKSAAWSCTACNARGEYNIEAGLRVVDHPRVAPDYLHQRDLALGILDVICARWTRKERFLLDLYLFGTEQKKAGEFIERRPIVDLALIVMQPKRVCYAVIHALNKIAEQEKGVAK